MPSRVVTRRRIRDVSVLVKIVSTVAVALVVGIGVGALGLVKLAATAGQVQDMYQNHVKPLTVLAEAQQAMMQLRLENLLHATSLDDAGMTKIEAAMKDKNAELTRLLAEYRPRAADPAAVDAFVTDWKEVLRIRDETLLPLSRVNDMPGFQRVRETQFQPAVDKADSDLNVAFAAEVAQAGSEAVAADATYRTARTTIIIALLVGALGALGLGIGIAQQIVGALAQVSRVAKGLAAGDLTVQAETHSRDEFGRTAHDLNAAVNSLHDNVLDVEQNAVSLAGSTEELAATSAQIAAAAEETSAQAGAVSATATQIGTNIAIVAASSTQLGTSISEIAGTVSRAAAIASEAVLLAEATTATIGKLGTSSAEIGNVINVITSIAEQTNLLALNATIEAARAGDAGKGFAVVAGEVKDLAQETTHATDNITSRVQAIQSDTASAVNAIKKIARVIAQINEFQTIIAGAVDEQHATTSDVVRNVAEAADGAGQISANVQGVAEAAGSTAAAVTEAQAATGELARMSSNLQQIVQRFRT